MGDSFYETGEGILGGELGVLESEITVEFTVHRGAAGGFGLGGLGHPLMS
jgi:hypothetical protein